MTTDPSGSQDEQVLLVAHKHWASLVAEASFAVVPGLMILAVLFTLRQQFTQADAVAYAVITLLVPLSFLIIWIILAVMWTNYYLDVLVVTDRRVFYSVQINLSNREIREWPVQEVRSVSVKLSGVLESLFAYGTLELEMKDRSAAEVPDIRDPEYVAAVILQQDDRYGELKETTRKQQELLKFLSHEVKGHLAKSKAAFAAIVEGDYGAVPAPLGSLAEQGLADSQKGVETVMSILEGSDAAKGELKVEKKPFDLSAAIERSVQEFLPAAANKRVALHANIAPDCVIVGDEEKIQRHVVRNLIDNAIRYTPAGEVRVVLERMPGTARFSVADTGVGIQASDMQKLFTQGGHGERSREVNPDSTGYGLFVAKKIVGLHDGRIWAYSGGPGTGAQFFAEFPLWHIA